MSNLAFVLNSQGKYSKAEAMNRQTLARYQEVLRPDHLHTLSSMSNLALVLSIQGRYEEAEAMNRQTLSRRGAEHRDTLMSMCKLTSVLDSQDESEELEPTQRRECTLSKGTISQDVDDVFGLQSVQSIDAPSSLTAGSMLSDVNQFAKTAAKEIAEMLIEDDIIKPLFLLIVQRVGLGKFKRNFFRLLTMYAVDLKAETSNPL